MSPSFSAQASPANTLAIVLGGGAGTRLFPLTKDRAKPAVPLGGKYRLVDIPISNCLNSGMGQIYVLTQFNSASLHKHVSQAYRFDRFKDYFIEILAAQQTPQNQGWYQGTADAVRQNIGYFLEGDHEYFLILSGDQLYRMDYAALLQRHIERGSDLTICTLPVNRRDATGFGILHTDAQGRITEFVEKPQEDEMLDHLRMPADLASSQGLQGDDHYQASMGIYLFNRQALIEALDNDLIDFGKHIIPSVIENRVVHSDLFTGYWEDIGTIRSFFESNLELARTVPRFDFFDPAGQIYTAARFLPASKVNRATITNAIISDGCIVTDAEIENAIIGIRSIIETGTRIRRAIIMGADHFELDHPGTPDLPALGIGRECAITDAIIDKNARIGDRCVITPENKEDGYDDPQGRFYIRDGIVVVPKNAVIPADTWI